LCEFFSLSSFGIYIQIQFNAPDTKRAEQQVTNKLGSARIGCLAYSLGMPAPLDCQVLNEPQTCVQTQTVEPRQP
jgi:hypothetical protein